MLQPCFVPVSLVIFLSLFSVYGFAQCPGSPPVGIECVAAGGSKDITAHSVCHAVTNNHVSSKALMIPTGTSTEWASFYNNLPAGVTLGACCVPGADPCDCKSIGQAASGTTALCAGTFDGGKYMIMPSDCADNTSNPSCSGGTDTLNKTWNDGTTNWYDIPGVTNVAAAATPSSSSERGHVTTPIIAAISAGAEGGLHAAARYCDQMTYGGFTDWYLPSKSEMAYIYCKASPNSHSAANPQENANCGGSGPTYQLTGFFNGYYLTSTENSNNNIWLVDMVSGFLFNGNKASARRFRCVRRY